MLILFIQMVSHDVAVTGYVSLPCRHTMAIALIDFEQKYSRVCSVSTHRTLPYGHDCPLSCKLRMTLLWLILIYAEKCWVPSVGMLAIAARTCVDVPSSVAVFALPDLLA
ncbi:hypothetical protein AVEN_130582-1 [Araneus ventricosus]|uniref:Uncharacterized protein n=1 Tax=Araneus ventricosus TaxID=182803 RepID=A0A4Y2HJH0_ARAVE|nr:hypothetical protein AVEN_130582-1 [Araneus ventricosus]